MQCKWIYKGHTFNSEIELDDFLIENKRFESKLGDLVFSLSSAQNSVASILEDAKKESIRLQDLYKKMREEGKIIYTEDGEEGVEDPPYIGVNKFLSKYKDEKGNRIIPEFIEDEYWNRRYKAWSSGDFNDTEIEVFELDKNNLPSITDPVQWKTMMEQVKYKWEIQAKSGTAVHNVLQLCFQRTEGNSYVVEMSDTDIINYVQSNLEKKNKKFLDDKIIKDSIKYARELYSDLKTKFGDDILIYPEFALSQEVNNQHKPLKLLGIIDMLVIDKSGTAHILDYKTSIHSYNDFSESKKLSYVYQMATYQRMLQTLGINTYGGQLIVAPIQLTNFKKDGDTYTFDGVAYDNTLVPISRIKDTIWDNIDEFMPSPFKFSVSGEKVNQNVQDIMSHWFPEYSSTRTYTKEGVIELLKKRDLLTPDDNGNRTFNKWGTKEEPIVSNNEVDFVEKVTKYLQSQPSKRLRYTTSLKSVLKEAMKNGINAVDFPTPSYSPKDGEVTWLKSTLSKYCNGNWEIVDNEVAESHGVILLKTKSSPNLPPQIDIVRVSTSILDEHIGKYLSKENQFKSRQGLTMFFEPDVVEQSKSNSLMVQAVRGNIELMETLLILNNLTGLNGFTIGNIQAVNMYEANGISMSNEELAYCFSALNRHYEVKNNNFANGNIKFATKYELARQEFDNILEAAEQREWKDEYKYFKSFRSSKSVLDQAINGTTQEQIEALTKLASQLEGKRSDYNRNYVQKGTDVIQLKQTDLQSSYTRLYNSIITAISNLKGIDFRQQLEEHDKWLESVFVWKNGASGTYIDNPGNLKSETLNLATKLVTEAYQNTRDDLQRSRATILKYVENLKKAHNFGWLADNTVGNYTDLYKNFYKETSDGDFLFVNPNTLPIKEDREFLEYALDVINRNRFPNKTKEELEAMKKGNSVEYYRVPLVLGKSDTAASVAGLSAMLKSKLTFLQPKKAFERARQRVEGIFNAEEDLDSQQSQLMFQMTNLFDKGENPEVRVNKIKQIGIENIEHNLENILLKHIFAYSAKENIDSVFPMIKASMVHLAAQGAERNRVYKEDLDYLTDYIRNKILNQQIVNEKSAKWVKKINVIKDAASTLTLAFSPVQVFYQSLQGLWQDISLVIRKPDGTKAFTFNHLTKAFKLVYSDLSHFSDEPTLFQLINETYGLNDMDMNSYTERLSTAKNSILYNFKDFSMKFASRPDYYNRSVIWACQMMGDGCLEAHTVKDGRLVYDWTKDARFSKFAANPTLVTSDPEYNKQKALYYAMAKQFVQERTKNPDGSMFELNMSKPMPLPRAYTNKEAEGYKSLADDIYGYYSHEKKSLIQATALGSMWMQFKTYWSGKKNQYLGAGGVKLRGKWVQKEENGVKYWYKLDKDGNPTREVTTENTGFPCIEWKGQWQEGIFLTLNSLLKTMYDQKSVSKGWDEIWNNLDENLKLAYRSNIKQFAYDLVMFALVGSILGAILGDWLDDLKEENKKNKNFVNGLKVTAANIAVMSVKNSFLDLNFIDSIGTPLGQWTPFAFDWGNRTLSNWWNVAMGDEDFWDGVVKSSSALRQFKPALDTIKPEMFRTESEGGTFGT